MSETGSVPGNGRKTRARFGSAIGVVGLLVAVACGGSESDGGSAPGAGGSGVQCGAGTTLVNGVCVPACGAGTVFDPASGMCVVGSAGGAAGSGGSSGAAGSGAGAGAAGSNNAGAAGATSGQGGSSGSAGWGDPHPGDQPCPAKLDINCSDSCGPLDPRCADSTCEKNPYTEDIFKSGGLPELAIQPTSKSQFPMTIRLPAVAEADPACTKLGCGHIQGYKLAFSPDLSNGKDPPMASKGFYVKVKTPPGWMAGGAANLSCPTTGKYTCAIAHPIPNGWTSLILYALGPAAAGNATAELSLTLPTCP